MTQNHRAGGTDAWWIRGAPGRALGSNVMMLAAALALGAAGCGPSQFPGREGFTTGDIGEDTGSGSDTEEEPPDLPPIEPDLPVEPECPELVNTGAVSFSSIEDLEEIAGVTKIDGDVEITGEFGPLEEGLFGLSCLEEITGFVYVHDTDIRDFTGLERLRRIGGYFYIGQTGDLGDLGGLSGLRQVGGYLHLTENYGLVSMSGTDLLVDVGEFIFIDNNPSLYDVDGLSQMPGTNGMLRIDSNASLSNLDGLSNMMGIRGNLGILGNPSLSDTSGLANIRRVGGNVLWQSNPGVWSLNLHSLETVGGYMIVTGMTGLSNLDDLYGLIGINNQLYIWDSGVDNIDGLLNLEYLGGDIWFENNPNLSNIDGLLSLTEAYGVIRIDQNPNLFDATGLGNLQSVYRGLSLWGNPNLSVIDLGSLELVAEYMRVGYSSLQTISAPQLSAIGDDLLVFNNEQLELAEGFSQLATIGGRLYFRENGSLVAVGFPALTQVFGRVQFIDNDALVNLNGLGALQLAQEVNIRDNASLTSIAGLSNLSQVPGYFRVVGNDTMSNIAGFGQLEQIGGDLQIRDNFNLQLINGFQALDAVGSDVTITGNIELPTCIAQGVVDGLSFIGGGVDLSGNLADACGG